MDWLWSQEKNKKNKIKMVKPNGVFIKIKIVICKR